MLSHTSRGLVSQVKTKIHIHYSPRRYTMYFHSLIFGTRVFTLNSTAQPHTAPIMGPLWPNYIFWQKIKINLCVKDGVKFFRFYKNCSYIFLIFEKFAKLTPRPSKLKDLNSDLDIRVWTLIISKISVHMCNVYTICIIMYIHTMLYQWN